MHDIHFNDVILGQSYDGASNMSGVYKGMKTRISDLLDVKLFLFHVVPIVQIK
jgi:hypothetical protein